MAKENVMKATSEKSVTMKLSGGLLAAAICLGMAAWAPARAVAQEKTAAKPAAKQKTFPTAQAAADAFIKAIDPFDVQALSEILGPEGEELISTKDAVQDKNRGEAFAAKAREKTEVVIEPKTPTRATLEVGNDEFPLAIPIVKRNGVWLFDTAAGKRETLYRRIGSNELDAIEICRGYVYAQEQYALTKHDGSEVNQYAQRVISTPGKHDGLVWREADGSLGGPIAEGIADALQEGYSDKAKPYHGYYFKILKGQGPDAPLGKMNFVVEGAMIGGFALAAAPAEYRITGVKTFIVSYEGVVYQKDLGANTLKIFQGMEAYNPDKTWVPTEDNWPANAFEASAAN